MADRYSILQPGDSTVELIKERLLELTKTLLDHECLSSEEVVSRLHIKVLGPEVERQLRTRIRTLEDEAKTVNTAQAQWIANRNQWKTAYESVSNSLTAERAKVLQLEREVEAFTRGTRGRGNGDSSLEERG